MFTHGYLLGGGSLSERQWDAVVTGFRDAYGNSRCVKMMWRCATSVQQVAGPVMQRAWLDRCIGSDCLWLAIQPGKTAKKTGVHEHSGFRVMA
ncbi:hypothetical protein [Rhodanobacter sp. K2T2]|uniref:hypothetical protein n=1 Tax=Rhodanobacter sp. K2T2 TaxID=2723085 RepID=UPI001C5422D1|nr:hypothetical protein [Rhodanobacter sp. K2T2]